MAAVPWSDLTDAQSRTLLSSTAMRPKLGAELLNPDLTFAADLSRYVVPAGGSVHWSGEAIVHRDASFGLATELPWGTALVRLHYTLTDEHTGLSAWCYVGAFCLATPDQELGSKTRIYEPGEVTPTEASTWKVTGQDRLYLLDRQTGRSYSVAAGGSLYAALLDVFAAAGVPASTALIDGAAQDMTVPKAMAWPLVPGTGVDSADDSGEPTTWLTIVNDLLALGNFRECWADEQGYYRCGAWADPATASPSHTFRAVADATDPYPSTVALSRTRSQDQFHAPNVVIGVQSNLGADVPPVIGAGLWIETNQSDGPSSVDQRGGMKWPEQVSFTAVDQPSLVAQTKRYLSDAKRSAATYAYETAPYPLAGHFDVFTLLDEFGEAKVEAQEWTLPLDGGKVSWQWRDAA